MLSKINLLTATALLLLPVSAQARDGLPYFGIEGGVMKPKNIDLDYQLRALSVADGIQLEHKTGFDADLIVGYDFGFIRAEGELGWKRASIEDVAIKPAVFATTGRPAIDGRTRAVSAMANLLLDFGSDDGLQFYGGGGVGLARTDVDARITGPGVPLNAAIDGDDRSLAWQLIAGIRLPVSYNVDLGLKYRYFNTKFDFGDANNGVAPETLKGRFRSHSLLASLIFNLGSPPVEMAPMVQAVAPPPPPPPPATQTCWDGSVILATDVCPAQPVPPPPPPAPVRG